MLLDIDVTFQGSVRISVPDTLPSEDALLLARKLVLAKILATVENPDSPDEDAFEEYQDECSSPARQTAKYDWDNSCCLDVGGVWTETS